MSGWKLTLPMRGEHGDAATVDPAQLSPPWLTRTDSGPLTFWAPVDGATTPNSDHARTELNSLQNYRAGESLHALTAWVSVEQVPSENGDVILGQIHGTADLNSVPFVMLHYTSGSLAVVVKQKRSGQEAIDYPLLSGIPLGARFSYVLRDNGDGTLTFTAGYQDITASINAPVPKSFRKAVVRCQAGAYQQASSKGTAATATDGARVTFYALDERIGAHALTSP
jgi:hypothetical protein